MYHCRMTTLRRCLLLAGTLAVLACSMPFVAPRATPSPTLTPTPTPALDPGRIWLSPDGLADVVMTAGADGATVSVHLPLNNAQRASLTAASPDGRYLAYLVWDDANTQHGVATWLLSEPNARLIYQPLRGYRVVELWIASDSATLLFVEQEQGKLPDKADWRLEAMPLSGGTPTLLANAQAVPDLLPPHPFGRLPDGSVLFNANTRYDAASGKPLQADFMLRPDGTLNLITQNGDRVVGDGALSPDGARFAYTVVPGALPGQPTGASAGNVARVVILTSGAATTLNPPSDMTIDSLTWMPDSARLLLDLVALQGDSKQQSWQVVTPGADSQPIPSQADPARARLFTYLPLGQDGVAYTLFPAAGESEWQLFLMPDLSSGSAPKPISLGKIDPALGAPRVIRTPQ